VYIYIYIYIFNVCIYVYINGVYVSFCLVPHLSTRVTLIMELF